MAGALLTYVVLCLTPAAVFGVILDALRPEGSRVVQFGNWALDRVGGRRRTPAPAEDPFVTLAVQLRLERLAAELSSLEVQRPGTARAHHLAAVRGAYDDVLDEACRMVGAPVPDGQHGEAARLRKEAELRRRGWSW